MINARREGESKNEGREREALKKVKGERIKRG